MFQNLLDPLYERLIAIKIGFERLTKIISLGFQRLLFWLFSRKNHSSTKDFELTSRGDCYFYSLGLPGICFVLFLPRGYIARAIVLATQTMHFLSGSLLWVSIQIAIDLHRLILPNTWATKTEKSRTFRYTGCVIGILIMAYYNPHMNGFVQSPINPKQPGFVSLHKW